MKILPRWLKRKIPIGKPVPSIIPPPLRGKHACIDCVIDQCPLSKVRGWDKWPYKVVANDCSFYWPVLYATTKQHYPSQAMLDEIERTARDMEAKHGRLETDDRAK